jgi:hypothetical protein
VGDRPIEVPQRLSGGADPGDQLYTTLEVGWPDGGDGQRLNMYFAADATHWWVSELRTYDGLVPADWIIYQGPFMRTPIGQAFRGGWQMASVDGALPGTVTFEGLTLEPVGLGTGPRPGACHEDDPQPLPIDLALDSTFDESDDPSMTPAQVGSILRDAGRCFVFRWTYPLAPSGASFGETWCAPPPSGTIRAIIRIDDRLVVFVDDDLVQRPLRRQPRFGWGC